LEKKPLLRRPARSLLLETGVGISDPISNGPFRSPGSPGWRREASVRPDPVGRIRQELQPAPIASVSRSAADGWPLRTGRYWRCTAGPTEKPFQAPDEPQRIRGSSRPQPGAREWRRPASPLEAQESPVRMVA